MARYIRPVSPDLLIQANAKIAADREKYGSPDVEVSIVTGFADDHDVDELIAVSHRLRALTKVLRNGDSNHWTLNVGNKEYKLVSEALFRAAAKTRLKEAKTVGEVAFDVWELLEAALKEVPSSGTA
jgi:hypothetical protein